MGVSTKFDKDDYIDSIINWIASGKTLRDWCRLEGHPSNQVVYRWKDVDEEFRERFTRARLDGADIIAAECLEIADNATNDYMEVLDKDGNKSFRPDKENVQRSKLRIETRLKLLAKWFPQTYGDKLQLAGDEKNPLKIETITRRIIKPDGKS